MYVACGLTWFDLSQCRGPAALTVLARFILQNNRRRKSFHTFTVVCVGLWVATHTQVVVLGCGGAFDLVPQSTFSCCRYLVTERFWFWRLWRFHEAPPLPGSCALLQVRLRQQTVWSSFPIPPVHMTNATTPARFTATRHHRETLLARRDFSPRHPAVNTETG